MNNELFSDYHDKLMFVVDGTLVETADSSDISSHRAIYNVKNSTVGYVFFLLLLHYQDELLLFLIVNMEIYT
jgi:hypothetical protein